MIGEVVGNFRIIAKLAEGGMGVVYRAEHSLLGKTAAVKVLLPELSDNREVVSRFFTEARAATAVRHPGIVEIYDFGYLATGAAYIVMELLDGEPLSSVLVARGRLTEQEALLYTRGLASALAVAHARDIVHRDLKPDNIFLVRDPDMVGGLRPKILDFGIAKVSEAQRAGGGGSKTRTGTVMGTPTYMSPEQCRGVGEVDHRSDLYAVGCILYEMLVGRPPFVSDGMGELLAMHQVQAPLMPSAAGVVVSHAAERLVLQLLEKRPEDRVQSAADLARLLGQGSIPPTAAPGAPTVMVTPLSVPIAMPGPVGPSGAPTTLSAAAGAAEVGGVRGRASRGWLYAGAGVVAAAAAIATVVVAGSGAPGPASAAKPIEAVGPPPAPPPPLPLPPPPEAAAPPAAAVIVDAGAPAVVEPAAAPAPAPLSPPPPPPRTTTNRGTKHHAPSTNRATTAPPPSVDRGD